MELYYNYFGEVQINFDDCSGLSKVIIRNYLFNKRCSFKLQAVVDDVTFSHEFIFFLVSSHKAIYRYRIDGRVLEAVDFNAFDDCRCDFMLSRTTVEVTVLDPDAAYAHLVEHLTHIKNNHYSPKFAVKNRDETAIRPHILFSTERDCYMIWNRDDKSTLYHIFSSAKYIQPTIIQMECNDPVIECSAGKDHALLLTCTSKVMSFGSGTHGELGHGTNSNEQLPRSIDCLESLGVKKITSGPWHNAVLTSSGDVYVWGWNLHGQLGLDVVPKAIVNVPLPLAILQDDVMDIATSYEYTLIKYSDGRIEKIGGLDPLF